MSKIINFISRYYYIFGSSVLSAMMAFILIVIFEGKNNIIINENAIHEQLVTIATNDFEQIEKSFANFDDSVSRLISNDVIIRDPNKDIYESINDKMTTTYKWSINNFNSNKQTFLNYLLLNARVKNLGMVYYLPHSKQDLCYKIDLAQKKVFLLAIAECPKFDEDFVFIPTKKAVVKANKALFINSYSKGLKGLIDISKASNEEFNKVLKNDLRNYAVALIVLILFFNIVYVAAPIQKDKKISREFLNEKATLLNEKEKLLNSQQFEILREQSEIKSRKDDLLKKEHDLLHDSRTNMDMHIGLISRLRELIDDDCESNKVKIKYLLMRLYSMERTLKLAISKTSSDPSNKYSFEKDFMNEDFIKFFEKRYATFTYTDNIMLDVIFEPKIKIAKLSDGVKSGEFYENELSAAMFRLVHNAVKHSTRYTKVSLDIKSDSNNGIVIKIANYISKNEISNEESMSIIDSINDSFAKGNLFNAKYIFDKYGFKINLTIEKNILSLELRA